MSIPPAEKPMFTPIFDRVFELVPCVQSSIYLLDGSDLKYLSSRGVLPPEQISKLNFPLEGSGGAKVAMEEDRPVLVSDVKGPEELALIFQESAKMAPEKTYDFIGSWIGFPIHVGGQIVSLLDVCHGERNFYNDSHVAILQEYIRQNQTTIENAILLNNLEQQSSEIETLNTVQQAIYSHLELDSVLQLIADHARRLTLARQIVIFTGSKDDLSAVTCAGAGNAAIQPGFKLEPGSSLAAYALENNRVLRVLNIHRDPRIDAAEAQALGIPSLMVLPLRSASRTRGVLMAIGDTFGSFSPNDERLLTTLASAAAIAIDNARSYRKERERRFVAEGNQEILAQLSSNDTLPETLEAVLNITAKILRADGGAICQFTGPEAPPTLQACFGMEQSLFERYQELVQQYARLFSDRPHEAGRLIDGQAPIMIDRLCELFSLTEEESTQQTGREACRLISRRFESVLHFDFNAGGASLGCMDLFWETTHRLSREESQVADNINRYIALTIDRERLSNKAEELALLQERQRIAQNLHDSVTQILFRSGLEAKWCLDNLELPDEAILRLQSIQHLITRSSYELRSAIFALSSQQSGARHSLVDLLQAQIAEFQNEVGINATLIVQNDPGSLSFKMVEAIYRLVREALSNIYKHANASAAFVSLRRDPDEMVVTIQDDGSGLPSEPPFDTIESVLHFGIESMNQMVSPFGGRFSIQNNDDQGVIVKATFPFKENS